MNPLLGLSQFGVMNWNYDSPVFDALLELNPWAGRLWEKRNELLRSRRWNVNYINQGGNAETNAWLEDFFSVRSQATLALLRGPSDAYNAWVAHIGTLAQKVMQDRAFAGVRPGSPMMKISDRAWRINRSSEIDGYSIGQFLADFLLLSQSSLRGMVVEAPLDISNKAFPIGLDNSQAHFLAPFVAQKSQFGPFSEFEQSQFEEASFSDAHFYGVVGFTIAKFKKSADFSHAVFQGSAAFTAVSFCGPIDFSDALFRDDALFEGAVFKTTPNFRRATFEGRTAFADATFHESADFGDSSFPGRVYVGRIPVDIKDRIVNAHHPIKE